MRRLRDAACTDPECEWCRERHDAHKELRRWFGFDNFRPEPRDDDAGRPHAAVRRRGGDEGRARAGGPAHRQRQIAVLGEVPALSRYDKTGALTVVISPLVALMADQVRGLEARGIGSCVTINGLLSMPEASRRIGKGPPRRCRYPHHLS